MLIFLLIGCATASDNSSQFDTNSSPTNHISCHFLKDYPAVNKDISTSKNKKVASDLDSGCCSVLVHVKKGTDIFAYRRDSTYSANIHIKKIKWYGKEAIKEYKLKRGYFFHTIITQNGWIVAMGGPDIPKLDRKMEKLAGHITLQGHISKKNIKSVYKLLKKSGMGHFIIKSPHDYVGLVIYKSGRSMIRLFKMKNKEYVCVPNSPRYYKQGKYTSKKSNPISAAIYVAGTDKWGVGRRNIITYHIRNYVNLTKVKIWASFDGGKLVKRRDYGKPDNIYFKGRKIKAKTLHYILGKKYLGQITLKKSGH